jgi:simple sugar transport system permease protein
MYKTPLGLAIQSVGDNPEAARTAGINPKKILWLTVLWGGFFSGLGGAHLATGYVTAFSQEMTAGRGFTAFTAIVFGAENPFLTFLATLVFGFADALGIRLEIQGFGLHPSLIKTFPFILAVLVLTISSAIRMRKMKSAKQIL